MATWPEIDDVIVVGGGLAGLCAGLRAVELGARVLLFEQGKGIEYPCNSRVSTGGLHVAYTSTSAPAPTLERAVAGATYDGADPDLARMLATDAERVCTWLEAHGASVDVYGDGDDPSGRKVLAPQGGQVTWLQGGRGPDLTLRRMADRFVESGGELRLGHRVREIRFEDGRATGVTVSSEHGTETFAAPAVIVADGGFQGDPELMRTHLGLATGSYVQRGAGTGSGVALRAAERSGANVVNLDSFYGHLLAADALGNPRLWPYPMLDPLAAGGVVVNRGGRRFSDEGLGGVDTANQLARSGDPYGVVICGPAAWESAAATAVAPPGPNPAIERFGGTVVRTTDLSVIAERFGIAHDELVDTIASYNAALSGGSPLEVPRTPLRSHIDPTAPEPEPLDGNLFAIACVPGVTSTMGGPLIDGRCRVMRTAGDPVTGLYAVGNSAGGFHGGRDVGFAGGLMVAAITGVIAAETVCAMAGVVHNDEGSNSARR